MNFLERMAEANIQAAAKRGIFDNLPGRGKPLPADEARNVPAELRAGYRLLKNAGFIPQEVANAREIRDLRDLLVHAEADSVEARRLTRRLRLLETTLATNRHGRGLLRDSCYDARLCARLARRQ